MFHRPTCEHVEKIQLLHDGIYLVKDKLSLQNYVLKELKEKPSKKLFNYLFGNYIFNHTAILPFYDFDLDHDPITILIDYCPKGSLEENINNLTMTQKIKIIIGICSAMQYLHSMNILHNNLCISNILLDDNYEPKIINIGLPRKDELVVYNQKTEVYFYGLIVYELITGQKNLTKIPDDVPFVLKDLIEKCLQRNPNDRPSFEEIFGFINNIVYLEEMIRIWQNTHSS